MNGLDTTAGILFGAYLLAVAAQGKSDEFIELAKRDREFIKWALAVGVLAYLYSVPALKGVVSVLIALAVVGFGLGAGVKFQDNVKNLWAKLSPQED